MCPLLNDLSTSLPGMRLMEGTYIGKNQRSAIFGVRVKLSKPPKESNHEHHDNPGGPGKP